MKTILFIGNNEVGLYKFRKEVIEAITKYGDVVLVFPVENKRGYFESLGCKVIDVSIDRRSKNPFTDLKLLLTYFNIIKKERPYYIFSYTIKPNIYVGLANLFFRKKFFPNITGLGSVFANNNMITKLVTLLYQISFKSTTKIFFQNESNMKLFFSKNIVNANKSILLPGSGVNLEISQNSEYPEDMGQIRFVFLGRIMREKGIYELIEAFTWLSKKHENIYLDIYGFCEDDEQIFRDSIKCCKNIDYKGFTDNANKAIIV